MGFFKPGVKTVGGGQAKGTANQFNDFLGGVLKGGYNPYASSGQQMGGFSGAINDLLGGRGPGVDANPFLSALKDFNPSAQNLPNQPGFVRPEMPGQPTFQNAQLGQYNSNIQGSNIAGQLGGFMGPNAATDANGIAQFMSQFGAGPGNIPKANFDASGSSGDFSFQPNKLLNYDTQSPEFQALKQLNDRQTNKDIADMRARFSLEGNSLGSGSSLAESQLRAEANPRNILAMGQLGRQMQEMDLGQQQINNNARIGLGGLSVQDQLGRLGMNADISKFNAGLAGDMIGRQGDLAAQILRGNQSFNLGQLGERNRALMADGSNALTAAGLNNDAIRFGNSDQLSQANSQNNFNLGLFGQNSDNVFRAAGMENDFNQNMFSENNRTALNNQNMINQFMLGRGGIGLDLAGMGQQGQLGILSQLFGAMNGANQLGTPQAQTVQTPSGFSQALGFAKDFLPYAAAPFTGGASLGFAGRPGGGGGAGLNPFASGRPPSTGGYNPANFAQAGGGLGVGGRVAGGNVGMQGGGMPLGGLRGMMQGPFDGNSMAAPGGMNLGMESGQVGQLGGMPNNFMNRFGNPFAQGGPTPFNPFAS